MALYSDIHHLRAEGMQVRDTQISKGVPVEEHPGTARSMHISTFTLHSEGRPGEASAVGSGRNLCNICHAIGGFLDSVIRSVGGRPSLLGGVGALPMITELCPACLRL